MIFNAGELSLVEYGSSEVIGTCRTEFVSPFLISVRLNEAREQGGGHVAVSENKKIAHLIDPHTIRVLDLVSGVTAAAINHDSKVDWLELNPRATHLLFRDKKRQVHLFDMVKQVRECAFESSKATVLGSG
jgi:intraflagellar transport protein 172